MNRKQSEPRRPAEADIRRPSCEPSDMYDEITDTLRKIKKERDRPLFVLAGDIDEGTSEDVCTWRRELRRVGEGGRLDILLASLGGTLTSCYAIARLFSRCCDSWEALVPATAASGATLILLGSANIVMSEISRLGPLDPQVASKRKERFSQVERQSPIEAFEAVSYLRRFALESLDVVMRFLLEERSITPHLALSTSSSLAFRLVEPIINKVEPYDMGALALDSRVSIEYCKRVGNPINSEKKTQRLVDPRKLVETYPTHDFFIDIEEAEALNFSIAEPTPQLDELFDEVRSQLDQVTRYVGLVSE